MANRHAPTSRLNNDTFIPQNDKSTKIFRPFDLGQRYQELSGNEGAFGFAPSKQRINLWGVSLFNKKWQAAYFLTAMLGIIRYSGTLLIGDALHRHNLLGILYIVYCLDDEQARRTALKNFLMISCRLEEDASSDLEKEVMKLEAWRDAAKMAIDSGTKELSELSEPSEPSDTAYSFIFDKIPSDLAAWLTEQAIQLGSRWLQENSTAILLAIWLIDQETRPNSGVEKSLSAEKWAGFSVKEKIDYVNEGYQSERLPFNIVRWADWEDYKEEAYKEMENDYLTKMRRSRSEFRESAQKDYEESSRHIREQLRKILPSDQITSNDSVGVIFSEYMITEGLKLTGLPKMKGYQRVLYPGDASELVTALGEAFCDSSKWFPLKFVRNKKKLCKPIDLFENVLGKKAEHTKKYLEGYWNSGAYELIINTYTLKKDPENEIIKVMAEKTIMQTVWNWDRTLTEREEKMVSDMVPLESPIEKDTSENKILRRRTDDFKGGVAEIAEQEIVSEAQVKTIIEMGLNTLKAPAIQAHLKPIAKDESDGNIPPIQAYSEETGEDQTIGLEKWKFFKEIVRSTIELVLNSEFLRNQFILGMQTSSFFSGVKKTGLVDLINSGDCIFVFGQRLAFKFEIVGLFFRTYLQTIASQDMERKSEEIGNVLGWIVGLGFGIEVSLLQKIVEPSKKENCSSNNLFLLRQGNLVGVIEGVKVQAKRLINGFFEDEILRHAIETNFLRSVLISRLDEGLSSCHVGQAGAQSQNDSQLGKGEQSPILNEIRKVVEQLEAGSLPFKSLPEAIGALSNGESSQTSILGNAPRSISVSRQNMWAVSKEESDKKEPELRSGEVEVPTRAC